MGLALSSNTPLTKSTLKSSRLHPRTRHPLIVCSAAFSVIATATAGVGGTLICSAFAAPQLATSKRSYHHRGKLIRRSMSVEKGTYHRAPPLATVSPFSRPVKKVVIVGGTHGNEYTVSYIVFCKSSCRMYGILVWCHLFHLYCVLTQLRMDTIIISGSLVY